MYIPCYVTTFLYPDRERLGYRSYRPLVDINLPSFERILEKYKRFEIIRYPGPVALHYLGFLDEFGTEYLVSSMILVDPTHQGHLWRPTCVEAYPALQWGCGDHNPIVQLGCFVSWLNDEFGSDKDS